MSPQFAAHRRRLPRLRLPITLGVVMIIVVVAMTVAWILMSVVAALEDRASAGIYWVMLSVGTALLLVVLIGTVLYLTLSIKAINLTRRQSNFIDSVTHELKSPIASLKLYLQTLNRLEVSEEERRSFYGFMLEDVERLDHLINQVLDAGRLERPLSEHDQVEAIDIAALLREGAASVCSMYRVPESVVEFDLEPCVLDAPRADLDIIFRNLVDNAIKYAGEPPEVQIVLQLKEDGQVVVQVIDNGRGIAPEHRRKIFGRFVRMGKELERDKPGTGLGLYITQTLVRRLKGQIYVTGRADTNGTVFEVRFPGGRHSAETESSRQASPDSASVA